MGLSRRLQADLCIVGLSAIWGCTFVVSKRALDEISPLLFIAVRFAVASSVLVFLIPRGSLASLSRGGLPRAGIVTGLLLFTGFVFQTTGLQHTTPSRSAFITGMYVIFTPLLALLLRMRGPSLNSIVGAILAAVGLYLLTAPQAGGSGFGTGETLTLLCALAFSGHLLAVDHYTRRHDARSVAFLQILTVAVLAIAAAGLLETPRLILSPGLVAALVVTSLLATALALYVLNLVQSWTTPTRAAIIFAAEPVFAALTSWVVEGEVLSRAAVIGAILILAGMLTAEIGPFPRRRAQAAL
ncbi:MAG TPA: DMT family transporter [Candidatus Polarisedimenticolia bacterium]|nr:DMT family transporter [Candidatus Polarisedimenticolia bacterium]